MAHDPPVQRSTVHVCAQHMPRSDRQGHVRTSTPRVRTHSRGIRAIPQATNTHALPLNAQRCVGGRGFEPTLSIQISNRYCACTTCTHLSYSRRTIPPTTRHDSHPTHALDCPTCYPLVWRCARFPTMRYAAAPIRPSSLSQVFTRVPFPNCTPCLAGCNKSAYVSAKEESFFLRTLRLRYR